MNAQQLEKEVKRLYDDDAITKDYFNAFLAYFEGHQEEEKQPDDLNTAFDTTDWTEEQRKELVDIVMLAASKVLGVVFLSLDLKTHMEAMIINDIDSKEYVLTFQTIQSFNERFKVPESKALTA